MDRLQAMEVFSRVVELGGFTRAADSLHLPKATVTNLVKGLEAHLGVRLLNRTTRHVSVTPDGAALYERAVHLLQEMSEIEAQMSDATLAPSGRLRVDVPASAGRQVIAPALPQFFQRYPEIVLELGSTDRVVDLIAEGIDRVIRGGRLHDDRLVARKIADLRVVTCASPAYLAERGTPKKPQDLKKHLLVSFFSPKTGEVFELDFAKDGKAMSVGGRHQVAVNDSETLVAAGLAGLGILQTPAIAVRSQLASGALKRVLADWSCESLPVYVMYPRTRHLSARVRAFVGWVSELYAAEPLLKADAGEG
ncbi:MAG: LysR family transcriptional regulator [Deltaproteobacteria bacterium]|nr:LysR family transcriptional regulator [Deltaproteobacteria bacterium]